MTSPKVAAVILAAGTASRFRAAAGDAIATKLVAKLHGKPLIRHVVEAVLQSRVAPVIIVTGHAENDVRAALKGLGMIYVRNDDYASGIASSVKCGIAQVPDDCDGAFVLLGDMPKVSGALLNQLIEAFAAHPQARAVVPIYQGERGNPALISRALFPEVEKLSGDIGARALLKSAGSNVVEVPVSSDAVSFDIDTPDLLS
jgi:molybdenum cofactor cytidylyltransferase